MPKARSQQIHLESTPFYHCMVRCVRRAFLCGDDKLTGRNYDHRRQWIVTRLKELASIFSIEICAYAVMSNHYHVVLCVDMQQAKNWTEKEVVERWCSLYNGHLLVERYIAGKCESEAESKTAIEIIEQWRKRLFDISWFMRCINEPIARQSNREDQCSGRFWEGRFKSQALLDETAVLTCMAYVDLNPVREGIAGTLEESDFTSIQQRLYQVAKSTEKVAAQAKLLSERISHQSKIERESTVHHSNLKLILKPFGGSAQTDPVHVLPMKLQDYFALVEETGKVVREDKRGAISSKLPPILKRLGIEQSEWVNHISEFQHRFHACVGSVNAMDRYAVNTSQRWVKGKSASDRFYR